MNKMIVYGLCGEPYKNIIYGLCGEPYTIYIRKSVGYSEISRIFRNHYIWRGNQRFPLTPSLSIKEFIC
jgi:hypothetical protein